MRIANVEFEEVWLVDFEFSQPAGERPQPVCLVAHELISGRTIRLFEDELRRCGNQPPYPISQRSLFVSYYAVAELSCHLALGWPLPACVLDPYIEFRNLTNGLETPSGNGLLGALVYFGLDPMDAVEKDAMRQLAIRGGPWTAEERAALLAYCESDVVALQKLFERMLPRLDIRRAVHRGRYIKAAARMEHVGIPVDTGSLAKLREKWDPIQDRLIARVDSDYRVFEGRTFKTDRFTEYLVRNDIPWPRLASGHLALDEDTFRIMVDLYPQLGPLRQLRATLSQMRLSELSVGADGRNRCGLSPFRARTSRNQPSNTAFIYGPAVWLRGLIQPPPGNGVAYIDWSQQEFGIAAALSGDQAMIEAYMSGDPYMGFAIQAKAVPPDATKASHGRTRDQFKAAALAVQYGMEAESLAQRIGQPVSQARDLLRLHRETYRGFWRWSDAAVDFAMLHGHLPTVFGWTIHVGPNVNPRSLRNFPMQANGAEMLRLACSLATERGVRVCAPVHDAILIEPPAEQLEHAIAEAQRAMSDASAIVLEGFRLRSDAKPIISPDRYGDERGKQMWDTVWQIIDEFEPTKKLTAG
jgi:DNA polymerase-1